MMQTLSPTSLFSFTLPPLPASSGSPHLVLWHPVEKAIWLLVPWMGTLWRVEADGTAVLLANNCLPEVFDARYVWSTHFYYDTTRNVPIFLASTYVEAVEHGLLLCALEDKKFKPIATQNCIKTSSSDSFLFDPERRVLFHFAGQRDMDAANNEVRKRQGGVIVRSLGPDGVWREVGETLPDMGGYETYAGFEPRRKLAVLIDNDSSESFGFDGERWQKLGALTTYAWSPNTLFADAKTGNLLYLQQKRESGVYTALLSELTEKGWKRRDAETLEAFSGALVHPVLQETLVFGPWFGPGTLQTTWGRYDGTRIVPMGKPARSLEGGTSCGPVSFWGSRSPGHGNYAASIRRPYSSKVLSLVDGDSLREGPSSPPVIAMAATGGNHYGVGFHGEVYRWNASEKGEDWTKIADSPSGFVERGRCLFGIDQAARLLLVGGEPCLGTKKLRDVWLFHAKWEQLATKGSAPLSEDSLVAFDEARRVWVIAGGTVKYEANPKTFELSEAGKWSSFLTTNALAGEENQAPAQFLILAWDEISSQLFAVARKDYGEEARLFVYRGEGVFEPVAKPSEGAVLGGAIGYDSEKRALFMAGESFLSVVAIGDALDDARKAAPTIEKKPKPGKTKRLKSAEEAAPDAAWLKLEQGDALQFWFARREGMTLHIESGKRGKKANVKTTSYESEAAAKKALAKALQTKRDAGYEDAPEREACAIVKGKKAFLVRLGGKGEDQFGGCPPGIDQARWPVCADCECPMTHVMTLKAHAERLPLKQHAALAVFVCCNEESAGCCETWDPDEGANAVLLLSQDDLSKSPLPKTPKSPAEKAASPTLKAKQFVYRESFEEDPENENPAMPPATSKVGGYPGWIQFAATPECSQCGKSMEFAAQLGELDDNLNFAGGDSYIFYCPDEHEGRFLWQH